MVTLFVYDYCFCPDTDNRGSAVVSNREDRKSQSSKNNKDGVLCPFVNAIDYILYDEFRINMSRFFFCESRYFLFRRGILGLGHTECKEKVQRKRIHLLSRCFLDKLCQI